MNLCVGVCVVVDALVYTTSLAQHCFHACSGDNMADICSFSMKTTWPKATDSGWSVVAYSS